MPCESGEEEFILIRDESSKCTEFYRVAGEVIHTTPPLSFVGRDEVFRGHRRLHVVRVQPTITSFPDSSVR